MEIPRSKLSKAYQLIVEKAKEQGLLYYSDLYSAIGLNYENPEDRRIGSEILGEIGRDSFRKEGVILSALVVGRNKGDPYDGFYALAQELKKLAPMASEDAKLTFWVREYERCHQIYSQMIKRFHSTLFYASDLGETARFYAQLGFDVERTDDGVRVKLGDFRLYFIDEHKTPIQNESGLKPKGLGVYTYVEVDDVDEYFASLKGSGVTPRTEPKTWPWGKRELVVKDQDGYKLVFYATVKK